MGANKGTVIVVADDNRDAADSLAQLLVLKGYAAVAVYDGRQAVAACRKHRPALAILDVQMPIMSGMEAARLIRAGHQPQPVVVSLTGLRGRLHRDDQDWQAFDFHLAKPLEMAELERLLGEAL